LDKIANARSLIDTDPIDTGVKRSVRQKKPLLIDEGIIIFIIKIEKKTEIERENRILLEKITKIIRNKRFKPNDAVTKFSLLD
jgi:hypothetical protein